MVCSRILGILWGNSDFFGTVRDFNETRKVESISIEHYPGMTESELKKIINEAKGRWKISAGLSSIELVSCMSVRELSL